jgi:hypothetical protein
MQRIPCPSSCIHTVSTSFRPQSSMTCPRCSSHLLQHVQSHVSTDPGWYMVHHCLTNTVYHPAEREPYITYRVPGTLDSVASSWETQVASTEVTPWHLGSARLQSAYSFCRAILASPPSVPKKMFEEAEAPSMTDTSRSFAESSAGPHAASTVSHKQSSTIPCSLALAEGCAGTGNASILSGTSWDLSVNKASRKTSDNESQMPCTPCHKLSATSVASRICK